MTSTVIGIRPGFLHDDVTDEDSFRSQVLEPFRTCYNMMAHYLLSLLLTH